MDATMVTMAISKMEIKSFPRHMTLTARCTMRSRKFLPCLTVKLSKLWIKPSLSSRESLQTKRPSWRIAFALNTGATPDSGGQENLNGDNTGLGSTRLGRIVGAGGKQLLARLNATRKNFPMKIFLLLLGFYTANALATILGQTGDWDVLVAGVVVATIEGIGMLMYKKNVSVFNGRFKNLLVFVNYWKAGVCLGLFVDAFKLGS